MAQVEALEPHPAVLYGKSRGWDYAEIAEFLGVGYGTFKQIARGFRGVSVDRSDDWERRTGGEIRSIDVLRWHRRNRRGEAA